MSMPVRISALLALPFAMSGCAMFRVPQEDVDATEAQIQILTQRVEVLETRQGIAPAAGAAIGAAGAAAPAYTLGAGPALAGAAGAAGEAASAVPLGWFQGRKAMNKLLRGVTNFLSGWVEIPKRVHETSQMSGPLKGFTWGICRGIGYGFLRTAGGVYEAVTFPFPAPSDYQPVLLPEYVWMVEG